MDELYLWANMQNVLPKSKLGNGLTYLKNQKQYIYNVLLDGRLEMTTNRAERSIKPFVMGRKNFLFCNTPKGAKASAVMYSIIETAKANGLGPYRYILFLLRSAPRSVHPDPEWIEKVLPWNVPED